MIQTGTPAPPTRPLYTDLRDVEKQLRASAYWSVRQLVCEIDRDRILLRGTVPCFYLKQVAQSLALKAVGAASLDTDIDVHPE